jgi:hypothetical protein
VISVAPGRALQAILGIVPATLTVVFAGLIALVALGLDASRRQYALDLSDRFVDLAAVLMSSPRKPGAADRGPSGDTD